MKTVAIQSFGGCDQFKDIELPIPEVKENNVRIKLIASSFNPVDYKMRNGMFGGDFPMVLGHDGSGVIDEIGTGVTNFKKGDEVYAFIFGHPKSNGAYAEYVSLPQQFVAHKPKSLSFEDAAGIPLVGLTALCVVQRAKAVKGQAAFVAGASGGVGSIVVQLLRDIGAYPIVATAGSDESAEYIHSHLKIPKEHIVKYNNKDRATLATEVKNLSPNKSGFPIAIDLWGNEMKKLAFDVLSIDGHVLTIVEEDHDFITPLFPSNKQPSSLFGVNGSFTMVFIGARALAAKEPSDWAVYGQGLEELAKLIDAGKVTAPKITNIGHLKASEVVKAHKELENGHIKGKLIISIP